MYIGVLTVPHACLVHPEPDKGIRSPELELQTVAAETQT